MGDMMSRVINNLNDLPSPNDLSVDNLPSPDKLTKPVGLPPLDTSSTPGMIESALRGVEQGATLGYGDELNSGLETLLNQATGNSKGLNILDEYRKHRGESREKFAAAEKENPITSTLSNLAGGVLPALASGGGSLPEQGLAGVAKMGAAYGALGGLGNSEADLTKGEVNKAASDAVTGGLMGAAVAPVAGKIGDTLLKPLVRGVGHVADIGPIASATESFKQGALNGRVLFNKKGEAALGQEISGAVDNLANDVKEKLGSASAAKLKNVLTPGDNADLRDWATSAEDMMNTLQQNAGADVRVEKDIARVREIISRHLQGVEESGIPGKGTTPTTAQAETLLRQLGSLGSAPESSGLQSNEGKELINRLVSPITREQNLSDVNMGGLPEGYQSLKELVNQTRPGLDEQNAAISRLTKAKEQLPEIGDVVNLQKQNPSGLESTKKFNGLMGNLSPEQQAKYVPQFQDLSKAKGVAEAITNSGGLSKDFFSKVGAKVGYGAPNLVGNVLYSLTPDAIRNLGLRIAQGGTPAHQSLGRVLSQAADKDQIGRQALFFALQQNPEYRKILTDMQGNDVEQK